MAAYADQVNALAGVASPGTPVQLDENTWQLDVAAAGEPDGDDRPAAGRRDPSRGRGDRRRRAGRRSGGRVRGPAVRDRQPARARARPPGRAHAAGPVADDRLGGAAAQGGADERADRRGQPGRADLRLPGRTAHRPARLHAQRRDRADRLPGHGHADLRAVDRLRRVPAGPDQGGPGQRRRRARVGRDRCPADRCGRHGGGDPAGGGDRRLQHQLDLVHPADRGGDGVRRPRRRVRGPVAAGARR